MEKFIFIISLTVLRSSLRGRCPLPVVVRKLISTKLLILIFRLYAGI